MSTVTEEMILEYIRKKGGRVKNVDLVKHFRKHLLFENKEKKEQAREAFKETVNSIAVIRQEEGEKFLYLKDTYASDGWTRSSSSPTPSPSRMPLQSVQQSPSRVTRPNLSSPQRTPQPLRGSSNSPVHTSLSNNSGRPTELVSNGRPMLDLSSTSSSSLSSSTTAVSSNTTGTPASYSLQNGVNEPQNLGGKPTSTNHKSPVPPPVAKKTSVGSRSPINHYPSNNLTPHYQANSHSNNASELKAAPEIRSTTTQRATNSSGLRAPPPPPPHAKAPVLTPPKTSPKRNNGGMAPSPPQSNGIRHPRPISSSHLLQSTTATSAPVNRYSQQPQSTHLNPQSNLSTSPLPQTSTGGRNHNNKKGLDISAPVTVTSSSNNGSLFPPTSSSLLSNDTSLLQHFTAELENFGTTGLFNSSPQVDVSPLRPGGDLPKDVPIIQQTASSENSSLSSISAHSTSSPPPTDTTSSAFNISTTLTPARPNIGITPAAGNSNSTSSGGVQKLIQQYTVPPGVVPLSPPSNNIKSPSRTSKVGRSASSVSNHSGNLDLRREPTPPDVRVQRSHSNVGNVALRRSKLLERNSTLDTLTRQSIKGTAHKVRLSHRLSKNSDELMSLSKEELVFIEDPDRDSPVNERDEDFIIEIDPLEREWVNAIIDGDMDSIHRILMTDNSYVNKKDFLNGWTALHWAAKLGREDMIPALFLSGAKPDIKSNGFTPLHLAAQSGNESIIRALVYEHNASTNIRDHSGKRPLDMLPLFASETTRRILRHDIKGYPIFRNASLAIAMGVPLGATAGPANSFNIPRTSTQSVSTMRKQWGSTGHLVDKGPAERYHPVVSPKGPRKGFSFRRKKYQVQNREKKISSQGEHYHERYNS